MFEFLKFFVESVARVIPAIGRNRRDDRIRGLGAELFLVYVQINEALIRGEEIVGNLEAYVDRMGAHLSGRADPYAMTAGTWVAEAVSAQRRSFAALGAALERWATELQVVDGESFAAVIPLLRGKVSALGTLLELLRQGELPTSTRELLRPGAADPRAFDKRLEIRREVSEAAIPTNISWDADVYRRVVQYLEERRPREQLAEIRVHAEAIRKALESHFTVNDLLLGVGDKRFVAEFRAW